MHLGFQQPPAAYPTPLSLPLKVTVALVKDAYLITCNTSSTVVNVEHAVNEISDKQNQILELIQGASIDKTSVLFKRAPCEVPQEEASPSKMTRTRPGDPRLSQKQIDLPSVKGWSCKAWCSCQCHATSSFQSIRSLQHLFGSLSISHSGIPYLTKPCNQKACRARARPNMKMSYRFPAFMQNAITATFTFQDFAGPEIRVKLGRVVGWTAPTWGPAIMGEVGKLQDLFERGLSSPWDVNPIGGNLLHYATGHWSSDFCRLLLKAGVDPLVKDDSRTNAAEIAWELVLTGKMSPEEASVVVDLFEDTGYLETQSFTVIHKTVLGLVSKDLDAELACSTAEIDTPDARGKTPLFWASARGDEYSVSILLKHEANPQISDIGGNQPLHYAQNTSCAELLISSYASIMARNNEGQIPLHTACRHTGSASLVDFLLKSGSDVNAADNQLEIPLHMALCRSEELPLIDILLDAGAKVNAKLDSGDTPLRFGVFFQKHKFLRRVLHDEFELRKDDLTADFNGVNHYGGTFSHVIAGSADVETVQILAAARPPSLKGDVTTKDIGGKTSLEHFEDRLALMDEGVEDLKTAFEDLLREIGTDAPIPMSDSVVEDEVLKKFNIELSVRDVTEVKEEVTGFEEQGAVTEMYHDAVEGF